ncbi:MAG TPA: hypothetical protein VN851_02400 [Thermoanaerobaculia bacterium]|nr:hypothetical protein [Thermoanaerobaculia bacterium]
MSWIVMLWIAAGITALIAVTGIKPKGTRHVAHTHMINAARVCFVIILLILAAAALKG